MTDDPTLDIPLDGDGAIEPLDWFWEPYLARGCLALLDGDPGVGKTFVALDLAARLTRKAPMPDGRPLQGRCNVIVANGDDVVEDTVLPRFLAAGGDRERLSVFGGLSRNRRFARVAEFPRDLPALVDRIALRRPVGLVVIDPLSAFFPTTAGDDGSVRRALAPFAREAAAAGTTFLFVRHLSKHTTGRPVYRGCGSIAFAAAARTVFLAGRHPDDPDRFVLTVAKSNLGRQGRSLAYRIAEREGGVGVVWDGPCRLTADDLCGQPVERNGPSRRAERWLHDLLSNGAVPAVQVEAEAGAAGIGFATLRAAKKTLGVESRKVTEGGKPRWEWGFPESEPPQLPPM